MDKFLDRYDAGIKLAQKLQLYANKSNVIVLALPRGGVPVAYEVATRLGLPLDVFIVRKLGVPGHEELAMGAIASGGTVVFNNDIMDELHIPPAAVQSVIESEQQELQRRELTYRDNRSFPNLAKKTVILIDDGIATGATMRAAIEALRQYQPAELIMAIPVIAESTYEEMRDLVDHIIYVIKPSYLEAVGAWYYNFSQTLDDEVFELLSKSKH